ncbi:DUF4397 domain-containing protein [Sphingobacterium tabacisoli]|uniref:DUF4397 domain-containing protein n=1 Tax=Sphingobacterium tabacisoli TaxID=2044855 RepID=A0ABW5L2Q2_9SPHI|nr:DUF4397 domain-containing protein [Sphingobacterium tabacisoli]
MNKTIFSMALVLLCFTSCKKEKLEMKVDNRTVTEQRANSNVRIINLSGFNQVVANGDSLTNFVVQNPRGSDWYKYPGTSYFPKDGRLSKIWTIPQDIFDVSEKADLHFAGRYYTGNGLNMDLDLQVSNSYDQPTDYYLMPTPYMNGQPEVVRVPRGVTTPSKPDSFKIRIVNLSGAIKNPAYGPTGAQESLTGAMSLAYADGTLVDAKTNNISVSAKASEYVEVPYGTYQFKVLMQDGRQVPAKGNELHEYGLLDPPTSTIPESYSRVTNLPYSPIYTYQPGGVYTILIAPQQFDYISNEIGETVWMYQNSFQVITDMNPPVNQTYYRIQGGNAFDSQKISFKVNGQELAQGIAFGKASDYRNLIHGNATIEAIGESGEVLARAEQLFRPNQNYTLWLYPELQGKAKLLVLNNDLSGTQALPVEDDGTYGHTEKHFFGFNRYLNLSLGNPYITFTANNGQAITTAKTNIQPGLPVLEQPYVGSMMLSNPYEIMSYRSQPNVVPGIWAKDIPVLPSADFIANPDLYLKAGRKLPAHEAGIYTVALIGRSGDGVPAVEKARMIIVKHNK